MCDSRRISGTLIVIIMGSAYTAVSVLSGSYSMTECISFNCYKHFFQIFCIHFRNHHFGIRTSDGIFTYVNLTPS